MMRKRFIRPKLGQQETTEEILAVGHLQPAEPPRQAQWDPPSIQRFRHSSPQEGLQIIAPSQTKSHLRAHVFLAERVGIGDLVDP